MSPCLASRFQLFVRGSSGGKFGFFLSSEHGPCYTAIVQGAEDTIIVDSHLGLHCQFRVFLHLFHELSKCCGSFPNPPVNLNVKQEVVSDLRSKVGELVDNIHFISINCDDF